MSRLAPTPGQTIGPFFGYALPYPGGSHLVSPAHPRAVRLHGTVRDGNGDPVPDALLEIWQPDELGRVVKRAGSLSRDGYTFTGWGRASSNAVGQYSFTTIPPGSCHPGGAPFIAMAVFARGLLNRLFTRVYLSDGATHASDPLLESVASDRRGTLIAARDVDGFRFDLVLQGDGETVFLRYPEH